MVMPPDEFERMKQTVESKDVPEEKRRMFLREFYSRSEHVVSDKQGRLLLSEEHCKRIGLEGEEVVMLGGATRFEIWNPKRREAMQAEHDAVFQELAGGMGL